VAKTKVMVIDEQPFSAPECGRLCFWQKDFEIFGGRPQERHPGVHRCEPAGISFCLGSDLAKSERALELGGRIARNFPNTRVVILSPNPNDEELFDAIRSSAVACWLKMPSG